MDYFFAGQIRQYRLQIIRAFSNFYVSVGTNDDGTPKLRRVPCRFGDTSRIAETIITGNSENKIPSAPFISVYVTGMALSPERRAAPSLVSTVNVNERAYDGDRYLNTSGNRYTVKRIMPVPFVMTVNVDFWTSNTNQKEELFEQTQVLFNGMVDIQTSNNPLDWTLFSSIEPTNITWSSRSIPIGTDNPIDVMTVEYRVPIWINPPAQVMYQKQIEQIVYNIQSGVLDPERMEWSVTDLLTQRIITPDQAGIKFRLVDDFVYEISLTDQAGFNTDASHKSTVIQGTSAVQLSPLSEFAINGVIMQTQTNNLQEFVSYMVAELQAVDSSITVRLDALNRLVITELQGGDIVLQDIQGDQIVRMGFVSTTYPGHTLAWWRLLEQYGTLRSDVCDHGDSMIKLLMSVNLDDRAHDVVGTIELHPVNQNLLIWRVDATTWPAATQPTIQAVIDPLKTSPNQGLPAPQLGQRYLITEDMTVRSAAWGACAAQAQDIIEYTDQAWQQVFDHATTTTTTTQLVKNDRTLKWYMFEDGTWQLWPLEARAGYWRLQL